MNKIEQSFLNAPISNMEDIREHTVYVLGAPFEGTVSNRKGTAKGPSAIRSMSKCFCEVFEYIKGAEVYDNSWNHKLLIPENCLYDLGDIPSDSIDRMYQEIQHTTEQIYRNNGKTLLLGGEHTVTIPAFQSFSECFEDACYVQIDSHMDFGKHSSVYGSIYRGAVSRRISMFLSEEYERMFWIGLSDYTSFKQISELKEKNANIYTLGDIHKEGIEHIVDQISEKLEKYKSVYVSLDTDVLDPSYHSGVSGPPIFGMTTYELLYLLHSFWNKNVKALDIVEHAPDLDITGASSYLIAQILFKNIFQLLL